MRIMYLLFSFTVGGTEKLITDICNEISKKNEVFLYIVNDLYDEELLHTLSERVRIVLQGRSAGRGNKMETILELSRYIRKQKIDVVHCNSFDSPELLLLHRLLFKKTKIVYTIHGVDQYRGLNKLRVWYRNSLCDSFVAISKSVANDIIAYGADPEKVQVIYNAIDLEKFTEKSNKEFDKNNIIIGNVARIDPAKKGQDILIHAVAEVKKRGMNVKCYFAGGADAFHQKEFSDLKELVEQEHLEEDICFLGNVQNIPEFLEKIDIFVLPSRFEGFGISLIEAMSMGKPCIACDLGGPAEIIGNNERGLLFPVGDSQILADRVIYLAEHYDQFEKQKEYIKEYVADNFNIVEMCKKLEKVYGRPE